MDKQIHRFAQFIILNSDLETNINNYESLFVIHFLFAYANRYQKTYYSEFAFELLQNHIAKNVFLLNNTIDQEKRYLIIYTGWYIIRFNLKEYFDIQENEEIFNPIDTIFKEEMLSLMNYENFDQSFFKIQGILIYCLEKLKISSPKEKKEITQILTTVFEKLLSTIKLDIKSNHYFSILIKILLPEINNIRGINSKDENDKFILFNHLKFLMKDRNDLLKYILLNIDRKVEIPNSNLAYLINNEVERNIKELYDQNSATNSLKWNLILMYCLFLIENGNYDNYMVIYNTLVIIDQGNVI